MENQHGPHLFSSEGGIHMDPRFWVFPQVFMKISGQHIEYYSKGKSSTKSINHPHYFPRKIINVGHTNFSTRNLVWVEKLCGPHQFSLLELAWALQYDIVVIHNNRTIQCSVDGEHERTNNQDVVATIDAQFGVVVTHEGTVTKSGWQAWMNNYVWMDQHT